MYHIVPVLLMCVYMGLWKLCRVQKSFFNRKPSFSAHTDKIDQANRNSVRNFSFKNCADSLIGIHFIRLITFIACTFTIKYTHHQWRWCFLSYNWRCLKIKRQSALPAHWYFRVFPLVDESHLNQLRRLRPRNPHYLNRSTGDLRTGDCTRLRAFTRWTM